MKIFPTGLAELFVVEPEVFGDSRGFFFESFNARDFARETGVEARFVQDNHSRSGRGVLRGLHYQIRQPQGKLVRVISGEIYDVVVDLRRSSATFGKWFGVRLTGENRKQIWVPQGFAHGFVVLGENAEILYKTTNYYAPDDERCIRWDDPELAIDWPLVSAPLLSEKDRTGVSFRDAETYA